MATIQQIKNANPEFFSRENNRAFGTRKVTKKGNVITLHNKHGVDYRYVKPDLSLIFVHSDGAGGHYFLDAENNYKRVEVDVLTGCIIEKE